MINIDMSKYKNRKAQFIVECFNGRIKFNKEQIEALLVNAVDSDYRTLEELRDDYEFLDDVYVYEKSLYECLSYLEELDGNKIIESTTNGLVNIFWLHDDKKYCMVMEG